MSIHDALQHQERIQAERDSLPKAPEKPKNGRTSRERLDEARARHLARLEGAHDPAKEN